MNPWTIIGWTLIAVAIAWALRMFVREVRAFLRAIHAFRTSLKTPPAKGQTWILNGTLNFVITNVSESGIQGRAETRHGGSTAWRTFTADEWRAMVSTGRAVLVEE
jgi:hypothetical protein